MLVPRIAITAATMAVVIVGDVHGVLAKPGEPGRANALFFTLLLIALVPSLVYAFGVRERRSVLTYGALLLGITGAAWSVVFLSDDPMRGIYVIPAWIVTMATSTYGALHPAGGRQVQRW